MVRVDAQGVPATAPSPTTTWGSVRAWTYVQGSTLARLKHVRDDVYIYKAASAKMRKIKCTDCPGPHSDKNTNCWATTHAGDAPSVITAPKNILFDRTGRAVVAKIATLEQFPNATIATVRVTTQA